MHHESRLSHHLGMRWVMAISHLTSSRWSLDRNHDFCTIDDQRYLEWQKSDVRYAIAAERDDCGSIPLVKAIDHFSYITDELIVSPMSDKKCLVSYDRFSELALISMDANQVAVEITALFWQTVFQQKGC